MSTLSRDLFPRCTRHFTKKIHVQVIPDSLFWTRSHFFLTIVWNAATCGGTLIYKHDELTSFFFSLFPFLFFLSRMPCLVVSLSAHSCACQEVILSFVSVDLRFTERMTGKSLCEMRGCVYICTQPS